MARGPEDLFEIALDIEARVSLDMERIESDPVYRQCITIEPDPATALQAYIEHYVARDRFLRDMPSTNGPGRFTLKGWAGPNASQSSS
jgi:hypothetical protein